MSFPLSTTARRPARAFATAARSSTWSRALLSPTTTSRTGGKRPTRRPRRDAYLLAPFWSLVTGLAVVDEDQANLDSRSSALALGVLLRDQSPGQLRYESDRSTRVRLLQ